jgi:hypothetical protein
MKRLLLLICLFGVCGCGFVFQDLTPKGDRGLVDGMSKEEVVARIGEPQKISKARVENIEYDLWEYPLNTPQAKQLNSLGTSASKIFFRDEKLVQLDQDRVYGQPGYEYLETVDAGGAAKTPQKIK